MLTVPTISAAKSSATSTRHAAASNLSAGAGLVLSWREWTVERLHLLVAEKRNDEREGEHDDFCPYVSIPDAAVRRVE